MSIVSQVHICSVHYPRVPGARELDCPLLSLHAFKDSPWLKAFIKIFDTGPEAASASFEMNEPRMFIPPPICIHTTCCQSPNDFILLLLACVSFAVSGALWEDMQMPG